jgi:hypothetical protein
MAAACMIEDSDGELRKQGDQQLKHRMRELALGEKQRGLGPRFHSDKIFKENQGAQTNKGKQRTIYKPKGGKLKIWPATRIKTGQDYRVRYINTHLRPLTTLCDNKLHIKPFSFEVYTFLVSKFHNLEVWFSPLTIKRA